jgi:NADH-ubiquinone oxidoreductase chain 5
MLADLGLSLFHLVNHALFKALLFLAAGAFIHIMANQQDLPRPATTGLVNFLPFTYLHSYSYWITITDGIPIPNRILQ